MKLIRKISIGSEYKDNAMHYAVGQEVYGGHKIHAIRENEDGYDIMIEKEDEILPWKYFNKNMSIAVEFDLQY